MALSFPTINTSFGLSLFQATTVSGWNLLQEMENWIHSSQTLLLRVCLWILKSYSQMFYFYSVIVFVLFVLLLNPPPFPQTVCLLSGCKEVIVLNVFSGKINVKSKQTNKILQYSFCSVYNSATLSQDLCFWRTFCFFRFLDFFRF